MAKRLTKSDRPRSGQPFFVAFFDRFTNKVDPNEVVFTARFMPGRVTATGASEVEAETRALEAMDLLYDRLEAKGLDVVAWWRGSFETMTKRELKEWRDTVSQMPPPLESGTGRQRYLRTETRDALMTCAAI